MLTTADIDQIRKLIDQDGAAAAALASARAIQAVLANHTFANLPATTTAVLTAAGGTSMGTATLTTKGAGNFRINVNGTWNSLNTLQPIVTPILTLTVNGINTITTVGTALLSGVAAPGTTSSPTVGVGIDFQIDSKIIAQSATNTSVPFAPLPGQTVVATLLLIGSTTGASVPLDDIDVTMQEIF